MYNSHISTVLMSSIVVKNVQKNYFFQHQRTLKEFFQALFLGEKTLEQVHALKNVSFEIQKGESVGVLGRNGAGKSTLLKLIAQVSKPTTGSVHINGRLAPLIELGAGFHPELSGRENIFLNAIILGMTEEEVSNKFDEIVEFAEIGEFVDVPIKYYSSGMYVRLAFSIAISTSPDILLVDEVLSVGDYAFQQKCLKKMNEFREKKVTILLVSHDSELVSSFCERVILLDHGTVSFDGNVKEGITRYTEAR